DRVFERKAPAVEEAIAALTDGQPDAATQALIAYLETGPCEEGVIGVGDRARKYADAAYDLALAFSRTTDAHKPAAQDPAAQLAQGQIPGLPSASPAGPSPAQGADGSAPTAHIDCALRLLAPLGPNESLAVALRARSFYLAGNLELSRAQFEPAVSYYDQALLLSPGVAPGQGDALGANIAFNRALALRLQKEQEEKQKQEQEQNKDEQDKDESQSKDQKDESQDQPKDQEKPQDQPQDQQPDEGQKDQEQPSDNQSSPDQKQPQEQPEASQDQKDQAGKPDEPEAPDQEQEARSAQAPPQSDNQSRDERMLDLLEQAPTLQQHEAQKARAAGVRGRATMEDK
ncbi:MAG TPA: hypothetical protein VN764_16675, partial [Polyangiaceae bacterium]|nr:hypothetical protein [Polyangiaceae bacterium]